MKVEEIKRKVTHIDYALLICLFITILSIVIRFPAQNTYNYNNSDATQHVVLTMTAYDETSSSVHKYLPIVSLGQQEDKNIPWGATIPDKYGNFYYTSFSPTNFFAPYVFVKLFHLPINETSLYLFNSMIMLLSVFATIILFRKLFKNKVSLQLLSVFVTILYLFQYEIMHSQGITYWVQSIYQLLFVLQILCFMNRKKKKVSQYLFWLLCIIIPYSEWTGYISNFGFLIASLIENYRPNLSKHKIFAESIKEIFVIALLTVFSFILFCAHYLLVVNSETFFQVLKDRFFARNIASSSPISLLFKGYMESFGYLIILIAILLCLSLIFKASRKELRKILKENISIIAILIIPLFENILMKEHAISYSYDRMKAIFILMFIFIMLMYCLTQVRFFRKIHIILLAVIAAISSVQLYSYVGNDNKWRWKVDYRQKNIKLADYLYNKYDYISVVGQDYATRGYTNVLFKRGVYESFDLKSVIQKSRAKKKRYAIYLIAENEPWCMYKYDGAIIFDNVKSKYKKVVYNSNKRTTEEVKPDSVFLPKITDQNWTNGVSNTSNLVILDNIDYNNLLLTNATAFEYEGRKFEISSIEKNGDFIDISLSPTDDVSILKNATAGIKVLYS